MRCCSQLNLACAAAAERDRVLEGARKEGRLVLYAGMDTEEATLFTNEFSKKYPFIKTEIFRSTGEKIQARFLVEHRANTHSADVFQASIFKFISSRISSSWRDTFPTRPPLIETGLKIRKDIGLRCIKFPMSSAITRGWCGQRTCRQVIDDLLNPKWKGWIALETEEYQWFYHWMQILGRDKGLDFMKKFAGQNLQMRAGHTLLAQLVAAGEVALATVIYSNRVERMKATGAPIDWVRFKGPTITAINAIAIPEKAPHPNAAKLFVDFALSKEGQNLLRGLRRIPGRPDVLPDPPSLTQGLQLYPARPEGMIENYNDTVARFNEIFNRSK